MFKDPLKLGLLIIIVIFVTLTSPWFYRISAESLIVGIILLAFSSLILLIISNKLIGKISVLVYAVLLVFTIWFTFKNPDPNLFTANALEVHTNTVRQGYYFNRFGPWIHNNYTLAGYKYQRNLFTNLNFNQFFFGGEPRFRPYALDFEKYSILYLPFFLLGIFFLIKNGGKILKHFVVFSVITFLIIALANPSLMLGLYPLFPIITAVISLGVYRLLININLLKHQKYDQ